MSPIWVSQQITKVAPHQFTSIMISISYQPFIEKQIQNPYIYSTEKNDIENIGASTKATPQHLYTLCE